MTANEFNGLVRQTLFAPREAAQALLGLKLSSQTLWMALMLMTVLNAIVYSVSLRMVPPSDPGMAMVPAAFHSPLLLVLFLFGTVAFTVIMLHRVGQLLGGQAALADVLVVMTWMQVLRLILQVATLVLSALVPSLGAMIVLVATVWGVVILTFFVDTAHRFDNLFKSFGVLILSAFAMVIGLSMLVGLLGLLLLGAQ